MPRTNRNTLKEYFKRGSMPNQKHFYELIDSMVNISDDGIDKNPDDGLRLAPSKENSPVISLFTNIQDNIPEWKIYLGNNSQLHIIRQGQDEPIPVSYTHLDVYKRQPYTHVIESYALPFQYPALLNTHTSHDPLIRRIDHLGNILIRQYIFRNVSTDVYKRQSLY